jgi:hypothetical protein
MITIEGMRRHLAHDGLPFDRHYIASLVTEGAPPPGTFSRRGHTEAKA